MFDCKNNMTKISNKFFLLLVILNLYLIFFLFKGENTIVNFISLQNKVKVLNQEYYSLLQKRYDLANIQALLQKKDADSDDVLDDLLRSTTQSSLPDEKIIILD